MKRVIDLSLVMNCYPHPGPKGPIPLPAHVEMVSEAISRAEIMGLVTIDELTVGNGGDRLAEVTCTVDPCPGTHIETYYPEKYWYPPVIEKKTAIRDVAQLPINQLVHEGVVLDLPSSDGKTIDHTEIVKAASKIKEGDIVFFRTGYNERWAGKTASKDIYAEGGPGLSAQSVEWLAKNKRVTGLGLDTRIYDGIKDPDDPMPCHRISHLNRIIILEDVYGLDKLPGDRALFILGTPLKCRHLTGAPARVVALIGEGADRQVFDLNHVMRRYPPAMSKRRLKRELLQKKSDVYKRMRILSFSLGQFPPDDLYGPEYMTFSSRIGTHIRAPYSKDGSGDASLMPMTKLCGPATVIDLSYIGPRGIITAKDLKGTAQNVRVGDIALIRTGFIDWYYPKPDFLDYTPGFSRDAIEWLINAGIKLLVTDMGSLEVQEPTRGIDADGSIYEYLLSNGIGVVECANNLWLLRKERIYLTCLPLPMAELSSAPTHVVALEDWN